MLNLGSSIFNAGIYIPRINKSIPTLSFTTVVDAAFMFITTTQPTLTLIFSAMVDAGSYHGVAVWDA